MTAYAGQAARDVLDAHRQQERLRLGRGQAHFGGCSCPVPTPACQPSASLADPAPVTR